MSPQRTLAETGRAWISSRVRWCLRFTTLWYQKTISDENKQMKDLTPKLPPEGNEQMKDLTPSLTNWHAGRLSGEFFKLDPLR